MQEQRVIHDADLAGLLTVRLSTTAVPLPIGMPLLNALMTAYWTVARRALGAPRPAK